MPETVTFSGQEAEEGPGTQQLPGPLHVSPGQLSPSSTWHCGANLATPVGNLTSQGFPSPWERNVLSSRIPTPQETNSHCGSEAFLGRCWGGEGS